MTNLLSEVRLRRRKDHLPLLDEPEILVKTWEQKGEEEKNTKNIPETSTLGKLPSQRMQSNGGHPHPRCLFNELSSKT